MAERERVAKRERVTKRERERMAEREGIEKKYFGLVVSSYQLK